MRKQLDQLTPGWDGLLVARPLAAEATFTELEGAVVQLLRRAGVLVVQ
jgi:RNase P protein component